MISGPVHATEAMGIVVILKAFSAGCSSLTGVEAIANAVPAFRSPSVKRAQRSEIALGILLGTMLLGLAFLIRFHGVVPRGNVTLLAQLSAAAFGTGWPFYVINLAVTLVLAFAANTSFGGLPVLMQLLARDHRLPHLFALRAEKPVFRYGITALALLATVVLLIVSADTQKLLPVFAIGVFIGFTISQTGLVVHWFRDRGPRWLGYALLNGFGAVLTAIAGIVLLASKFTEGAWLLVFLVPGLVVLMDRIERYYQYAGKQLGLGQIPPSRWPLPPRGAWSSFLSSRSAVWRSARCRPRCGSVAKSFRSPSKSIRSRLSGCANNGGSGIPAMSSRCWPARTAVWSRPPSTS